MASIKIKNIDLPVDIDPELGVLFFLAGVLLTIWVALMALIKLRRRPMDETARALWALLIVYAPLIGAMVFFIVRPGTAPDEVRRYL
ncbi:PLDc N-terminal domain-containing protein [Kiritimatiellaeota bacterium B1221]|nr:PLDc N-terminal domain-containing protein [Kiritimatiellaeota bacterium B1221]